MAIESGFTSQGLPYSRFGRGGPRLVIISSIWDVVISANQRTRMTARIFRRFGKHFDTYFLGRQRGLPLGYTTRQMGDDAAAAVREFGGPVHLVGLSIGAHIAQHLAAGHPHLVQGMVLAAAGARSVPAAHQGFKERVWPAREKAGPAFTDVVEYSFTGFTRVYLGLLAKIFRVRNLNRADYIVSTLAAINHDARDRLQDIRCPTLLVGGKRDTLIPEEFYRELVDGIRNSELVMLDGGHGMFVDKKKAFEQAAVRFLRELPAFQHDHATAKPVAVQAVQAS